MGERMSRHAVLVLAATVAMGCAKKEFVHPTKGPADFKREHQICKTEAMQTHYGYNLFIVRDLTIECLKDRYGWREEGEQ